MRIFSQLDPSRVSGERLRHIIKVLSMIPRCAQVESQFKIADQKYQKEKGRSPHIQTGSVVFRVKHT